MACVSLSTGHSGEMRSSSILLPVMRLTARLSSLSLLALLSFPPCLPQCCLSIFGLPALFPLVFVLSGSTTDTAASTSTSPCARRAICASCRGTINKSLKVSSKSVSVLNTEHLLLLYIYYYLFIYLSNFLLQSRFAQRRGYHRPQMDFYSQISAQLNTWVTKTTIPVINPGERTWHLTRCCWAT